VLVPFPVTFGTTQAALTPVYILAVVIYPDQLVEL
jgi:uncharacterized membrane protein